jgi:hypothetical protein
MFDVHNVFLDAVNVSYAADFAFDSHGTFQFKQELRFGYIILALAIR